MENKTKNIISLAVVLVPFYFVSIFQKIFFEKEDFLVEEYLGIYMLLGIIGIAAVLLLNKYLLGNKLNVFKTEDTTIISDIAFSLIILASFYFIRSIEELTYGSWIKFQADRIVIDNLLHKIFEDTLFSILIIGPFSIINEGFTALTISFILINLWSIFNSRNWTMFSIILVAVLVSLLQIDNGIPSMISSFLLITLSNSIFYKYRSVLPLFFASTIHQTINLISYWVYM